MCDYCGCRQVNVIAQLTREHDQLRELGRQLAVAANDRDLARARTVATELRGVLVPHIRIEERGLFPALAAECGPQLVDLADEHVVIDEALDDLESDRPALNWPARTRNALALLFDHILKEQDGVFPAALATLTPQAWAEVEIVREHVAGLVAR